MKLATTVLAIGFILSTTASYAQPVGAWARVEKLAPGGVVVVTDDSGAVIRGRVLRADAKSILLYAPKVETKQLKPVERLARDRAELLSRVETVDIEIPDSGFRISVEGITRKGVLLAAFADVFHVTPRTSVVSVVRPKDQRHSALGIVAGAAIGGAAGWFSGFGIALGGEGHGPSLGRDLAIGAVLVGGPVLGGMAGNALTRPKNDRVIYRR
jgi:hypothetical protein